MDRKLEILDILENTQKSLSLQEISERLRDSVPERTLRRILKDLSETGQIELLGGKKNRRYQSLNKHFSKNLEQHKKQIAFFSKESLAILNKLAIPLYEREPCTYRESWLESYKPNDTYYLDESIREQLYQAGDQALAEDPAGTFVHKIYHRLLIDLSYNSSRLEGNTYSLLETKRLLLEGKAAQGKIDSDKMMILNHQEALRFLVEGIIRLEVSEENIRTLHYLLADGLVLAEEPGNLRHTAVKVSGTTYLPLDNQATLEKIFKKIVNKAKAIHNPFEQSFFLLVHLSYLQAFIDVNRRTARLASNIPLVKKNLIPLSFNDIEVQDYRSAMIAVYEFNETKPLVDLYVWSYLKTTKSYKTVAEVIGIDELRVRYRQNRRKLIRKILKEKIVHKKEIDQFILE